MSRITQPVNQVRFTNVAIVRMNKHGKRFEIACYRNKITNYRQGVETDISEVLQTDRIFSNVSKGKEASKADIQKVFGTNKDGNNLSLEEVCHVILTKGEYQESDLERNASINNRYKEIATMIQEKCYDVKTNRRYTISVILEAMKKSEFNLHPTKSTKSQFLDAIKIIQKKNVLPNLQRAKMLLCVSTTNNNNNDNMDSDGIIQQLNNIETIHKIEYVKIDSNNNRIEILINPSLFRHIETIIKENDGYFLEILQQVYTSSDQQLDNVTIEQEYENTKNKALLSKVVEQQQQEQLSLDNLSIQENNKGISTTNNDNNNENTSSNNKEHKSKYKDDENEEEQLLTSNKKNKKAMKKSKKAKRREKASENERQERIQMEKQRQEDRLARDTTTTCIEVNSNNDNALSSTNMKSCNTCGGSFTIKEYRIHFKSDWHRFNLQLKLKGVPVISEEEFLMCDANILFD